MGKCYSVGHSTYEIEFFISLVQRYDINCIVDVRSTPYSKYSPQFNKENLGKSLRRAGIKYLSFGEEFGARRNEQDLLFKDGKVDFGKVIKSDSFSTGVNRIKNGISKDLVIGIMCAEKDPFECHRFALVARGLKDNGVETEHILSNGELITNRDLEEKLIEKYKIEYGQFDIFGGCKSYEDAVLEGYIKKNIEIAHKSTEEE